MKRCSGEKLFLLTHEADRGSVVKKIPCSAYALLQSSRTEANIYIPDTK